MKYSNCSFKLLRAKQQKILFETTVLVYKDLIPLHRVNIKEVKVFISRHRINESLLNFTNFRKAGKTERLASECSHVHIYLKNKIKPPGTLEEYSGKC